MDNNLASKARRSSMTLRPKMLDTQDATFVENNAQACKRRLSQKALRPTLSSSQRTGANTNRRKSTTATTSHASASKERAQTTLIKGGLCKKQMSKQGAWDESWNRRYFVLRADALECYLFEHFFLLWSKPRHRWELDPAWEITSGGPNGEMRCQFGYPFQVHIQSEEEDILLWLATEHAPAREAWVRHLKDSCSKAKKDWFADISAPTNFRHNAHLSAIQADNILPDEWLEVLRMNNMTLDDVKEDPEHLLQALDFECKDLSPQPPAQQEVVNDLQTILNDNIKSGDPTEYYANFKKIGQGGYGKIYLGQSLETGEDVAIKEIRRTPKTNMQRVLNEIAIMYKMKDHPNIVQIRDTFALEDGIWVVMEYMMGGSLTDILLTSGPLPEEEIAYVAKGVLKGLGFMHSRFRIHRDLKSDNILLGLDGKIKLADFGFTAQLTDAVETRSSNLGTPAWMAPEVIQRSQYNQSADIWSFGILCLEMAEREPPNLHLPKLRCLQAILRDPAPSLKSPAMWSPVFKDFLGRTLVKEPTARATADELLHHPFLRKAAPAHVFAKTVMRAQIMGKGPSS